MDAKSFGSMSSWCIGLKAGPAGFPERVRPGAGCAPGVISGVTNPLSAFAINCASSYVRRRFPPRDPDNRPSNVALVSGFVLGGRNGYLQPEGLRGPAPRG